MQGLEPHEGKVETHVKRTLNVLNPWQRERLFEGTTVTSGPKQPLGCKLCSSHPTGFRRTRTEWGRGRSTAMPWALGLPDPNPPCQLTQ